MIPAPSLNDAPDAPPRRRWRDAAIYAACVAGTIIVLWGFFLVQAIVFIGRFEPVFLLLPAFVGTILGSLMARVLILQRRLRQTNETLQERHERDERFRLAMQASEFAVWDWKLGEDTIFCSHGGDDVLGGTSAAEYIPGDWWQHWIHPDDQARFYRTMNAHIRGETERYECEYRVRHEDGGYRWVCDRAVASRDDSGRVHRIAGVIIEISDRKATEQALLAAKEEAETANRTKSAFLANMSHELRTPLNAIIGFSEIMQSETFGPIGNPKYAEYAGDIRSSGQHLLEVINDILDLSRVESGILELSKETVDLAMVAGQALRMVEEAAQRRNIRLDVSLDAVPSHVVGDPRAIRQILLNLLSNSIKFTPEGGSVRLGAKLDETGRVCISVTDTGIGMHPEDIPVALAPFRQIDSSLARAYEGTGLGLPLAKALTEMHGGELSVTSEPGRGTEIVIALPQAERAAA